MVSFDHQSNILLQRIIVILSESIFWFKIQDIIRDVSLGQKDNWGLFVSLTFWVWLTYLAVCRVSRQKLLYLPSWLSGSSFLSFPFPSLVLGTPCIPVLWSSQLFLLWLLPYFLYLICMYVCMFPEVRPSSLLAQQLGLCRFLQGATSLSQRWDGGGWGPPGRRSSRSL